MLGRRRRALLIAMAAAVVAALVVPVPAEAVTVTSFATAEMPLDVAVADLNGDLINDLVVGTRGPDDPYPYEGQVSVLLGNGDATYQPHADTPVPRGAFSVATGDLDLDNDIDVVAGQMFYGAEILLNDGSGGLSSFGSHPVATREVTDVLVTDLNGDTYPDLAAGGQDPFSAAGDHLSISINAGYDVDGNWAGFLPAVYVLLGEDHWVRQLAAGDIEGDGDVDLVMASASSFIDIVENQGDGTFADLDHISTTPDYSAPPFEDVIVPLEPTSAALGDVDGDGNLDIVASFTNDTRHSFWILPGNGDTTFDPHIRYSVGNGTQSVAIGDVNGDLLQDIVVVAEDHPFTTTTPSYVLDDPGTNGFPGPGFEVHDVGNRPRGLALGQLNGDLLTDYVTADSLSDGVSVVASEPPVNAAPTASIVTPADGVTYAVDEAVYASYSCDDDTGVQSCDGTLPLGDPIDTSTEGTFTFDVTATDVDGQQTIVTSTYYVGATASDTTAPTITISTPLDGGTYGQGDAVFADYLCDDGGESGVFQCIGDVDPGDLVDTSTPGSHSFTVYAMDNEANQTELTVYYDVVSSGDTDPPMIWISRPTDNDQYEQDEVVQSFYLCVDAASAIATCDAPVPSGAAIDTSQPGWHSFEVTASDVAGNEASQEVWYQVLGPEPPAPTEDTWAPIPIIRTPVYGERYNAGSTVTVDFECLDYGPVISGVASCTGSQPDGAALDTAVVGTHTFTVVTTDNAGNTWARSVPYEVVHDSDGDSLPDAWETDGIDVDDDGTIDLALGQAPYNADPMHKDLFIEMDWMECGLAPSTCTSGDQLSHKPAAGVAESVVAAFAAAPLTNPDGQPGATLHLTIDQAVPEISVLPFNTYPRPPGAYDDYDDIKLGPDGPCNGAFGTAAERASADCEDLLAAKSLISRYGLWGHHHSQWVGSSGLGEYPGNDFIVTVGGSYSGWNNLPGGIAAIESATLMHEAGHTLGLGHGGPSDDVNCKPNYLSVMSYAFQSTDYYPGRPLDFSRSKLPDLDEATLVESAGIGGAAGTKTVFGFNTLPKLVSASGPIDWNVDGDTDDTVAGNPNSVDYSCFTAASELLKGADDWHNLKWGFYATADNASGSHFSAQKLDTELPEDVATNVADSTDADGDGFSNLDDVCPSTADPAQSDIDADGEGDVCDAATTVGVRIDAPAGQKPKLKDEIKVAVLATPAFDPNVKVDKTSLTFGKLGTEHTLVKCLPPQDINKDGRRDLVCTFRLQTSGLVVGSATGKLQGRLVAGPSFVGEVGFVITK